MKIWCGVCEKEEAIFFCCADEAALCEGCDRRVHHANKLASKHSRFSLLHPAIKESPLCDICQERRAFLFCQEDRAILCRECDLPIHRTNEHTQNHNRFLLTGVKLSSSLSLLKPTSSSSNGCGATIDSETTKSNSNSSKRFRSVCNDENFSSPSIDQQPLQPSSATANNRVEDNNYTSDTASISTSSISEYLMETLPGWRVDDFLDPSSTANGYCKTFEQVTIEREDSENNLSCCSSDEAIRMPQVFSPPRSPQLSFFIPRNDLVDGFKEFREVNVFNVGCGWDHESFLVPQISSSSLKKSRHFW